MPTPPDEPVDDDATGPRRWLTSGSFDTNKVQWQDATTVREKAQVLAAKRQHRVAGVIRVEKARTGIATAEVARQAGIGVHQLRRMLRGDAAMPPDVAEAVLRVVGYRTAFKVVEVVEDDESASE